MDRLNKSQSLYLPQIIPVYAKNGCCWRRRFKSKFERMVRKGIRRQPRFRVVCASVRGFMSPPTRGTSLPVPRCHTRRHRNSSILPARCKLRLLTGRHQVYNRLGKHALRSLSAGCNTLPGRRYPKANCRLRSPPPSWPRWLYSLQWRRGWS